ncbi:ribosome-associated translation inhibitor RaiA [Erysipelothrix sp. HDW6C]|uniref:ribosome hibernation-promoting factor, HPF/YfiA family n=1 Tax=Erysipelothrix sp. HDW6C TaxID=2714930 RepID=UPI0014073B11|nr:ribosome-associated translation inhibitor RaiA [Erysipelothrix sp. HDW6C]QIK69906.1 ribosome-associated translation inhibitor RaiA [Erysipelothrix sp. HDW6C]
MLINIHGKNVEITDAMHAAVEDKLEFLHKYFEIDDSWRANVVVNTYPAGAKVEVTITSKFSPLRAEVMNEDFYAALDKVVHKLEDQIRRHKTRLSKRNREGLSQAFVSMIDDYEAKPEAADEAQLVRTKTVVAESMNLNDAVLDMEMLGHTFFIYTDDETNEIAVVYKRLDGDYGLLEVEREND